MNAPSTIQRVIAFLSEVWHSGIRGAIVRRWPQWSGFLDLGVRPADGVYAVFAELPAIADTPCLLPPRSQVFGPDHWRINLADAVNDVVEARKKADIDPNTIFICRAKHGKWRAI